MRPADRREIDALARAQNQKDRQAQKLPGLSAGEAAALIFVIVAFMAIVVRVTQAATR